MKSQLHHPQQQGQGDVQAIGQAHHQQGPTRIAGTAQATVGAQQQELQRKGERQRPHIRNAQLPDRFRDTHQGYEPGTEGLDQQHRHETDGQGEQRAAAQDEPGVAAVAAACGLGHQD